MNHTVAAHVDYGRSTFIRWAIEPKSQLLVFVHGFRGRAARTWGALPDQIIEDDRFAQYDLVFFDYESKRRQIQFAAYELRTLISSLVSDPSDLLKTTQSTALGTTGRKYDSVLIVAHSMGAIIARRAVLDDENEDTKWAGLARLVLFAPAHVGARVTNLISLTLAVFTPLEALVRALYPCLDEMEQGSAALVKLMSDSDRSLSGPNAAASKARKVFMAEIEQVVYTTPFLEDPAPVPVRGTDHLSVCKERLRENGLADRIAECL